MTTYAVFLRHEFDQEADPQSAYEIVGQFEASDAKGAIRQAVEKMGADAHGRTFAAVPKRGWLETPVSVETKPVVKLG